jgi:hypothetical protein
MRKVREGLDLLKLPSDLLLRHGASRLVYGVALVRNLKRYLLGQDANPEYLFPIESVEEATLRVSEWWVTRWLAKRFSIPRFSMTLLGTDSPTQSVMVLRWRFQKRVCFRSIPPVSSRIEC